jgi:LysR family hydrogen peroxide-inducible transcriptional activator
MEIHQLRYMVAVARTRNFSRAAEECHVAQPSLSQQIKKLEDELDERLFDRLKGEVKITARGERFLGRAKRILDEIENAKREVQGGKELLNGMISLGILPTLAPYLLPKAMTRFLKKYPGIEITIQEDQTSHLLKLLHSCDLDFALISRPIIDDKLEIRDLFTEELLVALPPKHRLARQKEISFADLSDEKLIVMKDGHCLGEQMLNFCERNDLHTKISFRSSQLETVLALVRDGFGISLVPEMATHSDREKSAKFRPFTHPRPKRKIAAAWSKNRPLSLAAREFVDSMQSA